MTAAEIFDKFRSEFDARLSASTPMISFYRWWLEIVRNLMVLAAVKYVEVKSHSMALEWIYLLSICLMALSFQQYVVVVIETFLTSFRPSRSTGLSYYMLTVAAPLLPIALLLNLWLSSVIGQIAAAQWAEK